MRERDFVSGDDALLRYVALSDLEVTLTRVPLATLLRARGIDPDRPYVQRTMPAMQARIYVQRIRPADAEG